MPAQPLHLLVNWLFVLFIRKLAFKYGSQSQSKKYKPFVEDAENRALEWVTKTVSQERHKYLSTIFVEFFDPSEFDKGLDAFLNSSYHTKALMKKLDNNARAFDPTNDT